MAWGLRGRASGPGSRPFWKKSWFCFRQGLVWAALLLAWNSPLAAETAFPASDYLSSNWGGARDRLRERGSELSLHYTSEPMFNVAGGEARGGSYVDNIGLDLKFDLDRIFGGGRTTLLIKLSQRNGDSVSADYVAPSEGGNTFTAQELFGGQTFKLANVQFNSSFLDNRFDLAYGRVVANDDFLRSDLYCQFVNNAFCGSPKAVFLHDPFTFSAYPTSQWGVRARYDTPSRGWTFQGAIYDGDPELKGADISSSGHNPHGTKWELGDNGVVLAGEAHYHVNRDSVAKLPGVYKIGAYAMSGEYRDISRSDKDTVAGNAMLWLLADQMLFRESPGSSRGLSLFGSVVLSLEDKVNQMDSFFSLGLLYQGLFDVRPLDKTGLAVSGGWFSDELEQLRSSEGLVEKSYEAVIELNHRFVLEWGLAITPLLQYVIRPAGTGEIDNGLLLGSKVSVQF